MNDKTGKMKDCGCGGHSDGASPKRAAFKGSTFKADTSNVVSAKKTAKKKRK